MTLVYGVSHPFSTMLFVSMCKVWLCTSTKWIWGQWQRMWFSMNNDLHFGLFFTKILWLYGVFVIFVAQQEVYNHFHCMETRTQENIWKRRFYGFGVTWDFSIKMNRNDLIHLTTDISPFKPFRYFLISQISFFQQVIEISDLSFLYIWSSLFSPFKEHPLFYRMHHLVYQKWSSLINILQFSQSLMLSLYISFCKSLSAEVVGCIKSAPWLHPLLPRPPQKEATDEFWAMSHTAPYLEFLWASPLNCFKLLLQRPASTSPSKSRKYIIIYSLVLTIVQHFSWSCYM